METECSNIIKNRLNSLYRDTCEAEKQEGYGLSNSAKVIAEELNRLLQYCFDHGVEIDYISFDKTESDLGDRGYMQYIKTNIRKLADYLNIKFEVDVTENKSGIVLNVIQSQNVIQDNSQVFENMISNINKLDIHVDTKKEIKDLIHNFKDESTKNQPDIGKLKEWFKKIESKSKESAVMLSYWATISGVMQKIFDHITSLPK